MKTGVTRNKPKNFDRRHCIWLSAKQEDTLEKATELFNCKNKSEVIRKLLDTPVRTLELFLSQAQNS